MRPPLTSRLAALALAGLLGPVPLAAHVGAPPRASAQDPMEEARRLYQEGQRLFDARRFAEAEARYRRSYELSNNARVLPAIAAAQEGQGNIAGAIETLQLYLQRLPNAPDRSQVQARLRALTQLPGQLRVESVPPGAAILVDGRPVSARSPTTIQLPAGPHRVRVTLPEHDPFERTVEVQPRATVNLRVQLQRAGSGEGGPPASGPPNDGSPSAGVWVLAGVSAATLISGTVFGFLALNEQSDFDANPTNGAADRGEAFAVVADISFGVSLAAFATGLILYIVQQNQGPAASAVSNLDVTPWASAEGGGMGLRLRF